jgi:hypothetical protein
MRCHYVTSSGDWTFSAVCQKFTLLHDFPLFLSFCSYLNFNNIVVFSAMNQGRWASICGLWFIFFVSGKQGAKQIVEKGEFPRTASALREVRGIGDYTAGAIASIAFNEVVHSFPTCDRVCACAFSIPFFQMILWPFLLQVVPVVDGNVVRVLSRLYAIADNPKDSSTMKRFWLAALSFPC